MTEPTREPNDARSAALALVRRHGWNAMAFQALETGYAYFFDDDDACVAYFDSGSAWIAAGEPICAPERLERTALAFASAARRAGRRAAFFGVERPLGPSWRVVGLGEQPVWDPREWPSTLATHRSLREQLRRARAKGVRVRRLSAEELASGATREAMERLLGRWLATRPMAPMGFVVRIEPFDFARERICLVAEVGGSLVGFAGLVPVPARNGWFLEDLLRAPSAPNGASESLVDAAMRAAADEGASYLTLGMTPLFGEVPPALARLRSAFDFLYDFDGLRAFKAKLRPAGWTPVSVALPLGQSVAATFVDVLSAFAGGSLARFGLRSLLRGSPAILRVLTALLVPWTILLACAPAERWFGGELVKWAWVAFDVSLVAGLSFALARPRVAWLTALALAVSSDAIVTTIEALAWNAPRARSVVDAFVVLIACAAPALAAIVLWGARRTRMLAA